MTTIQLPFNLSLFFKQPHTCKEGKSHTGLHRNGADFHPSHTGRSNSFYLQAEGNTPPEEKLWGGNGGRRGPDEWSWVQCAGTQLTRLPSSRTSAALLLTLTGCRLRAKISSHFLTEGHRDTVLRINGHIMLSML